MRAVPPALAVLLALGMSAPTSAPAAEGMWLLDQIGQLPLEEAGFQITAQEIYSPGDTSLVDAIVSLGASAAFVSPQGLVLTNHHVAFGDAQRASREDGVDYLTEGYIARDRSEERRAPGRSAEILLEVRDVTERIEEARSRAGTPVERARATAMAVSGIEEEAEAEGEGLAAEVVSLYEGAEYRLYLSRRFEDVRLVYFPPTAIGNYGGEVDNWEWPRHTGDFAFLRVYASPEGEGRAYHPDNVPYRPRTWLTPAADELDEGDPTFILGFPRSTSRFTTHHGVRHLITADYPADIARNEALVATIERATEGLPQGDVIEAGRTRWIYNGLKYRRGVLRSMERISYLEEREAFDRRLQTALEADPELATAWGSTIEEIGALYAEKEATLAHDDALKLLAYGSAIPLRYAFDAYHTARERAKPEHLRDLSFSERSVRRSLERLHLRYLNVHEQVERALLKLALEAGTDLPEEQQVGTAVDWVRQQGSVEAGVEAAFASTRTLDGEFVRSLYEMNAEEIEALDDSMVRLAVALYPEYESYDERSERHKARLEELRRGYIAAIKATGDGLVYPDATGTMRFTWGEVTGYSPADGILYTPQTTLAGALAKHTGAAPFDLPAKLRELHERGDTGGWTDPELGDVPLDFLHAADITGGNSGSAVMNGRGELIGTAFDGNWEALVSDWQYQPATQRTISCDIRYVQFITERFQDLEWIVQEMEAGRR